MRELGEAVVVRGRAREVRRGGRKEGGGGSRVWARACLISGHFSAAGELECKVTVTGKHESKDRDASSQINAHQNNINLEECTQSACSINIKRSLAAHRLSLDRSETHLKNPTETFLRKAALNNCHFPQPRTRYMLSFIYLFIIR